MSNTESIEFKVEAILERLGILEQRVDEIESFDLLGLDARVAQLDHDVENLQGEPEDE